MNKFTNKNFFFLLPVSFLLCALLIRCTPNIAGSEITNETALIFMPDGTTPAAQAKVTVIPVDYIPNKSGDAINEDNLFETTTDSHGFYTISGISKGQYNIIAQKDTFSSYQDSVSLGDRNLQNDTLNTSGSLTARIQVQPNHNPQTATIQLLGTTSYFSNVDTLGNFTLSDLPEGKYQLRIVANHPDYTPTFYTIQIHSGKNDTLKTPIKLIYTGIPVVNALKATYNPVTSIVTLKWDNITYQNFNRYLIYRGKSGMINDSMPLISSVTGPVFNDTLSNLGINTNITHVIKLQYQVAVQTKSLITGELSNISEVTVIFTPNVGRLLTTDTTTYVPGTPFKLSIVPDSLLGTIPNYFYALNSDTKFIEISKPETTITIPGPIDSISENQFIVVKITTAEGVNILDTLHLQSQIDWEKLAVPFAAQITGYYATEKDNKLLVYAENGAKKTIELWSSTDGTSWIKSSDSLPFNSMAKQPLLLNGKVWILERDTTKANATLWSSINGIEWIPTQIDSLSNAGYSTDYEVWSTIGNQIILMNYYPACLNENNCNLSSAKNCWSTTDGLKWHSTIIQNSLFPDRLDIPNKNFIAQEISGSLVVAGAWRSMYLLSPAYKNYSFRIWNSIDVEPEHFSFPTPVDSTMIGLYNPQAAIFRGSLFLAAQINMESSVNITKNTNYLWKLRTDKSWYLCCKTYPAVNTAQMKHNYHALIAFNDRLYSISNAGVWKARR
jgi:hypothetical protein